MIQLFIIYDPYYTILWFPRLSKSLINNHHFHYWWSSLVTSYQPFSFILSQLLHMCGSVYVLVYLWCNNKVTRGLNCMLACCCPQHQLDLVLWQKPMICSELKSCSIRSCIFQSHGQVFIPSSSIGMVPHICCTSIWDIDNRYCTAQHHQGQNNHLASSSL